MGLLRPPSHRGPLIAAGAVVLTVGVAVLQNRYSDEWDVGVHFVVAGALAALLLWLGFQNRLEGGAPPAFVSVLLVAGLLALLVALFALADVLGADIGDIAPGTITWIGAVEAGVAGVAAARRNSAVCALIAAVAGSAAFLAGINWIFGTDSLSTYRWLLLLLAVVFAIASLPLRGLSLRHAQQMVNAAGLAVLAIVAAQGAGFLFGIGGGSLPGFWEAVVLAGAFGLVAYSAADRAPGPAYIGTATLLGFAILVGEEEATVTWWPLLLILLGGGTMLVGLRPRSPLPPEPDPYHPDELPLAARTGDDVVVRVRAD